MPLIHAAAAMAADAPNYLVDIQAGAHRFQGDEAEREGGRGIGPAPFELLLASLCACTAATLRMYLQRKDWPAVPLHVHAELHADHDGVQYVRRTITIEGDALDAAQRARLGEIGEKTPVTLFLKRGTRIETTLR
ncbi:OsmC family protein [Burkholderia glumae]|uniref:OsmC family protein n=2 Tax=Burkholderia glumae TaxID=337 RepID=A0AAP9XZX1_BURGL|nr:OsmC family protein [Burkholderia glumae]ACR32022.1 OsmC family protein [Burkholderia glumae BGR1]AJY63899.1 osmC-like family protein [Burkholderia glumae LMG 2196 = ATCC 33617]MCM2484802.1 OsmC family protein [Burkholderia glumae]MCM2495183.1 OsmC family protein [Burkholderia glumae]MCM2510495.1 OsmC family protein [Burkholderia glumae]